VNDASSSGATGELAQHLSGFDPTAAIAAQEAGLLDYLSLPTRAILDRLGLSSPAAPPPAEKAAEERDGEPAPAEPAAAPASPIDPMGMISPVTDALGTLGSGMFDSMDPTSMFGGISDAFDSAARTVSPAVGGLPADWQGASGTAAADTARAALVNGSEVSAQASGLRAGLANAAAVVAQARARHIDIISEFQATIAAIGPNIVLPWGWAAAVAAAARAVAASVEVITETQATLGAEAATTSAIGAPVSVAAAPALASSMIGPLAGLATGMIGPLTSLAGQGGPKAAESQPKRGGEPGSTPPPPPTAGGAGAAVGSGGGAGAAGTPASRALPPMSSATLPAAATSGPTTATRVGASPMPMGGPMMGAPMAGAGLGGAGAANGHTAASFLHTSNQGGEIVGDLDGVAPPVIGEADPHQSPDVELRI
jgi:hypothetical protein